ncbi:hypothetical protein PHLGIDRAFT_97610 [Phlebiopsis gigantea 11061_1 CR5-6]|uniref:holo-[acyl-carrier-protein] synthase n=1 Tax=Phlebiopsis gigantea (strain 11061_1 CR5-6) TaxID=745531 RepID=A0A0C3PXK7_PHLG1|nr:hypothetical protein PHLGIDRAFT_97610 [Phlebiopsis gigantea 11061_1 CR5-6]
MQVWVTTFDPEAASSLEGLYLQALGLLNEETKKQVTRYYQLIDRLRTLLGKLLIRMVLKQKGIPLNSMSFGSTPERKPYVTTNGPHEPIGYNITHDSGLVAVAFQSGPDLYPDAPAYRIGVDAMLLQVPDRLTFGDLVESVGSQLTPFEEQLIREPTDTDEKLRRFYLVWTLKEAYSKALGIGLGLDFKEIEYDVPRDVVRISGSRPVGWKFIRFEVRRGQDEYVGVVVRYVGADDDARGECIVEHRPAGDWLKELDAGAFIRQCLVELK